jgi:hypothetical protein
MEKAVPHFAALGEVKPAAFGGAFGTEGRLTSHAFDTTVPNFYMTDAICRASPTMAKCVGEILPLKPEEVAP